MKLKFILFALLAFFFGSCTVIPHEENSINPLTGAFNGESTWIGKDTKATFKKKITKYDSESRATVAEETELTIDRRASVSEAVEAKKAELERDKQLIQMGKELGSQVIQKVPIPPQ